MNVLASKGDSLVTKGVKVLCSIAGQKNLQRSFDYYPGRDTTNQDRMAGVHFRAPSY